jgi:alpha-1,2-mannosyltransferase
MPSQRAPMRATEPGAAPGSAAAAAGSRAWWRPSGRRLLIAGAAFFAFILAGYFLFTATHAMNRWMAPVDLSVYRIGGEIAAGNAPRYLRLANPLYGWAGTGLKFTYTPFAALVFTILTVPSWALLLKISIGVNIAALLAAIWATLGGLGYRASAARLGGTLLIAGAVFWTEPVQRTLYLGQIELLLMALIMWDMCQPDRHRWKGVGIGIAAGIKLVPLVFIPYLLLTRRFRQAGVATATFVATILLGFAVLPADSRTWWLDGIFIKGSRTGFVGWEGNQSLQALITRLSGSIAAGQPVWLAAAAVTLVVGLAAAALLDQAGHRVAGVLTCALTGLLVSPISWDHHWVWIVPAITVLAVYGLRARGALRWCYLAGAALIAAVFGAWPGFLWGQPLDLSGFGMGLIWIPPNTNPGVFAQHGDQSSYAEYHWHGFQLLTGNLYVLTGILLLVLAAVLAARTLRARWARAAGPAAAVKPAPAVTR